MTSLSDILFPSQEASLTNNNSNSINRILGDLKRSNLSITNRLRSIQQDANFVEEVRSAFGSRTRSRRESSSSGSRREGDEEEADEGRRRRPKRPLVANERCGSWYIRPEVKGGSAYFKSTDGHTGQWKFSTRRLNLHLLPIIERFDGIIIVDSTRRGKRMPDALSKTIPIWCCVLNRALFPDQPAFHDLYVPPNAVSASEKSQMLARVPEGLEALRQLRLDLAGLRAQVSKPLRPTWVTQETDLNHYDYYYDDENQNGKGANDDDDDDCPSSPGSVRIFDDFRPVICCTASRRVTGGEMSGHTGYIQGAGDDTENWAHGLTPPVFWAHADELLATPEAELPDTIKRLVVAASDHPLAAASLQGHSSSHPPFERDAAATASAGGHPFQQGLPPTVRRLTPYLYVSPLPIPRFLPDGNDNNNKATTPSSASSSSWCRISLLAAATPPETWVQSPTQLDVGLGKHKVASRNLRVALSTICEFVIRYLQDSPSSSSSSSGEDKNEQEPEQPPPPRRKDILIACETGGRDLSIGVALALLCWCFADDEGNIPFAAVDVPPPPPPPSNPTNPTTTATATGPSHKNESDDNNNNNTDGEKMKSSSSLLPPPPQPPIPTPSFNKTMIKIRLGRIMTAMPDANPNRATLQSVNSFLMDWRR